MKILLLFFMCCFELFAQENPEKEQEKKAEETRPKPPLEMKISLGASSDNHFSPIYNYAPFFIELTNHTQKPFEGAIRARVEHEHFVETYECPVQISEKTGPLENSPSPKKRFYLPIYLKDKSYVIRFELYHQGKPTGYEEFFDVQTIAYGESYRNFLVFNNNAGEQLKYLEQLFPPNVQLRIHQADPEKTTSKELNLFFYDLVILEKLNNYDLGASFYTELERYVALGGNLLISTGDAWQTVQQKFNPRLFQSQLLDFGEKTVLGTKGPIPFASFSPALQAQSFFLPKTSFPYLVLEPYGNGTVSVLAMDLRYIREVSENILALQVVPNTHKAYFFDGAQNEKAQKTFRDLLWINAESDLSQSYRIKLPTKKAIFIYLCTYLFCLVPLNFFFFRLLDRLEFAWISIAIMALSFFAGITYYQEENKLSHFVGMNLSVTQLANQTPYARSLNLLTTYCPDPGFYRLEMKSSLPGTLYPASFIGEEDPFATSKVTQEASGMEMQWKDQQFILKDVQFWAGSKRSFLLENYTQYPESPYFQLDFQSKLITGYGETLKGEYSFPFDLLQGFLIYRTESEYQFFSLNATSASSRTPFQGEWSQRYKSSPFVQKLLNQLKKVSPDFSPFQERQFRVVLDHLLREPLSCFFIGYKPSSTVALKTNQQPVELRSWELIVMDLNAFHPNQKQRGVVSFPEQTLSEENNIFPIIPVIEGNPFLLCKTKLKKQNSKEDEVFCEVEYHLTPSLFEKSRDILFYLHYYPSAFHSQYYSQFDSGYGSDHYSGHSKQYPPSFSLEVEIWDPALSGWRHQPLLLWKSDHQEYFEKRVLTEHPLDLKDFVFSPQQKIRLRYKMLLDNSKHFTPNHKHHFRIEALFPEKGTR